MNCKKKLIEVALPLDAINKEAAREKSIRHGHPSTLHLWWARRPLATCRAVLFAQMVDDPSSHPDKFHSEEDQERERQRLFDIIENLVKWENSSNEVVLEKARAEIRKSCNGKHPQVYDPFSGGGSIPLEAQRLGLKAYGSDLNPVAVMIGKALVEIPPKFANNPPVNPDAKITFMKGGFRKGRGAQGLAEDIRYYGQWMRDEAEKRIGHFYPTVEATDEMAMDRNDLKPLVGLKLTVIAWLWARTVPSPNPAAGGAHVPLVSSFWLCKKQKKQTWLEPIVDGNKYDFNVRVGDPNNPDVVKTGTKLSRGANFRCVLTGSPIEANYVKAEGKAGRMGWRLMAIVANGPRGRVYFPPLREHEDIAKQAEPDWRPEEPLSTHPQYMSVTNYGPSVIADLFMDRQTVALTTFGELLGKTRYAVIEDAKSAGWENDEIGLADGGINVEAYADAVTLYLGMGVSRLANRSSTNTFWHTSGEKVEQVFARQALPMMWDTAEGNPFSDSTGNFIGQLEYLIKVVERTPAQQMPGVINQQDARKVSFAEHIVSTDPPYYDNVPYADLSDFFYVWLRHTLKGVYPSLFSTILAPKAEELVADHKRHDGKENAERFFMAGMTEVMHNIADESNSDFPVAIYYAFRQTENQGGETSSTGWETFLEAVVKAGFEIKGTWPMRTELVGNLKKKWNALASSIILACRKRPDNAPIITRAEFIKALHQGLPEAITLLQHGNIAPVDMAQTSIGPGMSIFTRYSKVLESDDSHMTVRTALQLINAALDEFLSEQESEYDSETRFAITWFETHGMDTGPYGVAETLATARGISVNGVQDAGILISEGGKVRLLRREEIPAEWDPVSDTRLTVWKSMQHLIQVMQSQGEQSAAELLTKLGSTGDFAKDLAYRLYGICERKKWADEGLAYNSLVISWPELTRLSAAEMTETDTQSEMTL